MRTIILPGFSIKNKEWAESTKEELNKHFPTEVYCWKHWSTNQTEPNWIEKETNKLIQILKSEKVNILAKSIGTLVAMHLLKSNPGLIKKIILCGIPLNDLEKGDVVYFNELSGFDPENVSCIQNQNDNHGSYDQIKKLISVINNKVHLISKDRNDHEYPYWNEFISFFTI